MEYLTISKFAERAGVTPQAIYKRVKADLAPFTKEENGIKLVSEEALELFRYTQQVKFEMREQELLEKISELENLVQSLTQDKLDLLSKIAETNTNLLEILNKQTQQQENFQILLAQNNLVYSNLTKLLTTSEEVQDSCSEVELKTKKPSLLSKLFSKK